MRNMKEGYGLTLIPKSEYKDFCKDNIVVSFEEEDKDMFFVVFMERRQNIR